VLFLTHEAKIVRQTLTEHVVVHPDPFFTLKHIAERQTIELPTVATGSGSFGCMPCRIAKYLRSSGFFFMNIHDLNEGIILAISHTWLADGSNRLAHANRFT
jgi:hypothetical protein